MKNAVRFVAAIVLLQAAPLGLGFVYIPSQQAEPSSR